jgi:hypothetical protein
MNLLDQLLLDAGNEAFDETPPVVPVEPVVPVVEPVVPVEEPQPEDAGALAAAIAVVAELEAERDYAQGSTRIAQIDSELASGERAVEGASAAVAHIEQVQAGLEHFIEAGSISAKTAGLLQDQINHAMGSIGKSGLSVTSGGLEAFGDDPDQMLIVLSAGLNALEEEKKGLGDRAKNAIKGVLATIGKFASEILNQAKRHEAKATELEAAIKGKPEKEVKISSQALMVGKEFSKDIAGDLNKFKEKLIKLSATAMQDRSNWYFKTAPGVIAAINGATTADEAVTAAAKLQIPPVKGVTVSVKDEDGMSLKRSEVVLGNYALFEMATKAPAPTDTASAVAYLRAAAKARVSIKRAGVAAPEALATTLSEAQAAKILGAVKSVLTETTGLKSIIEAFGKQSLDMDADGKGDGDKDVRKIASAASALPDGLVDTVSQLPRTATRAAMDVVEASLAVVSSFAKGGKAEKPAKEEPKKDEKPADDKSADDKSGDAE